MSCATKYFYVALLLLALWHCWHSGSVAELREREPEELRTHTKSPGQSRDTPRAEICHPKPVEQWIDWANIAQRWIEIDSVGRVHVFYGRCQ